MLTCDLYTHMIAHAHTCILQHVCSRTASLPSSCFAGLLAPPCLFCFLLLVPLCLVALLCFCCPCCFCYYLCAFYVFLCCWLCLCCPLLLCCSLRDLSALLHAICISSVFIFGIWQRSKMCLWTALRDVWPRADLPVLLFVVRAIRLHPINRPT